MQLAETLAGFGAMIRPTPSTSGKETLELT